MVAKTRIELARFANWNFRLPEYPPSAIIRAMSVTKVPNSLPLWQQRTGVTWDQIALFCGKWGLSEFSLFGSILQNDFSPGSDVDVLVRLDRTKPHGGWDWVDMIEELKIIFGRKIDLVSADRLENPFFHKSVMSGREVVYAA